MGESSDVVVVGGGVIGVSIAFELISQGISVTLFDANAIGEGVTSKSPGVVRAFYPNLEVARLADESITSFKTWENELGTEFGLTSLGVLTGISTNEYQEALAFMKEAPAFASRFELLAPVDVQEAHSDLCLAGVAGFLFEPDAGYCDVLSLTRRLADIARQRGAKLRTGVRVERIMVERGRVCGLVTSEDEFYTQTVVNAAGLGAPGLAMRSGFPIPVTLKGHRALRVVVPEPCGRPLCPYAERHLGFYFRPYGGGEYVIGCFDAAPTAPAVSGASPASFNAHQRFGRFREAYQIDDLKAVFDVTPDDLPLVGCDPRVEGLFLAVGMSGHGFKFSPQIGAGITREILQANDAKSLTPFSPKRIIN